MPRFVFVFAVLLACLAPLGCRSGSSDAQAEPQTTAAQPPPTGDDAKPAAPPLAEAPSAEPGPAPLPLEPFVALDLAAHVLHPEDEAARQAALAACAAPGDGTDDDAARIACMLTARFAEDTQAAQLAAALYTEQGSVVGVEASFEEEVGWRGRIRFVPALPVGGEREHLEWVVAGMRDIEAVLVALEARAGAALPYRWRALTFRFYRTVERTTPSAYASGWRVAYNVDGSLMKSADAVRETLFHELFHLNDFDHDSWSSQALLALHEDLVARCTKAGAELPSTKCLKPFAPGKTKVKGGTWYAFQPGNGVHEYAAELALRYFLEQRAWLADAKKKPDPFKCATPENAQAWQLLVDEFFAGVDLVPACEG